MTKNWVMNLGYQPVMETVLSYVIQEIRLYGKPQLLSAMMWHNMSGY